MHQDTPVAVVTLDSREYIETVEDVLDKEHLPCVYSENDKDLRFGLQRWLLSRTLGRTRSDYAPLRSFYGNDLFHSKTKVSLYDKYWLRTEEGQTWDEVNPFKNWDSDDDCYFSLLFDPENTTEVDNTSPNLTIPGSDHKFWYRFGDDVGIITDSAQKDMQIYKKAKELGVLRYVAPRSYMVIKGIIYSFHKINTSENVERIPFDLIYDEYSDKNKSKIDNLKKACEAVGLSDWRDFFGTVMQIDEALGNKERELCEIGVLRNANTLEVIGFEAI